MYTEISGTIILERPYDPECDYCPTQLVDNFIIYDDGKIAFEKWYPEFLYIDMIRYIYDNLLKSNPNKTIVGEYLEEITESADFEGYTDNRHIKNIANWFDYTNNYNSKKERDILTAGKQIKVGDIEGFINRIEGNDIYIEPVNQPGISIIKVTLNKTLKTYKIDKKDKKEELQADISLQQVPKNKK